MKNYLIASESYHILNEEVQKISSTFSLVINFDLRVNSLKEILSEASYYSLTGEKKCIVFKCSELFKSSKKDGEEKNTDIDIIEKYLENPSNDTTIIFCSNILPDKRKKLYKWFDKEKTAILFPTLNKKELCYKCMNILKEKGYNASYEVANFIVENSYANYDVMLNELEKIYILVNSKTLTIDNIENIISKAKNNTTFNYVNAIIHKDIKLASEYSKNFEALKIEGVVVLIMLYKEFEILKLLLEKNNPREVQYMYKKEDWQMNNYMQEKSLYTLEEVKKIIVKLNDYDYKFKSGLIDKDVLVDLLTIDFCE